MRARIAIMLGLGLAMAAPSAMAAPDLPVQRRHQLREMVVQDCGACHGMTLKGGLGSPLLPEDLSRLGWDAVVETILDGRPGTPMPPWKPLLSRDDAGWIAAYLLGEVK